MKILIVAATIFEVAPLVELLKKNAEKHNQFYFQMEEKHIYLLVTGVGGIATAFAMGRILSQDEPFDIAFNIGIAGAYNRNLAIGEVVNVQSEIFGDLGVEDAEANFMDLFDLELAEAEGGIFTDKKMLNPMTDFDLLPSVDGITVNKVNGSQVSIDKILQKYTADVESMEGAAFFYACLQANIRFLEIRAISNYVEPRNRDNWNLPLAIDNLNDVAWGLLQSLK